MRWEELKKTAETIVKYAEPYETSYNRIQTSVKDQKELRKVLKTLVGRPARLQILQERNRMIEARRVAESQKELYRLVSHQSSSLLKIASFGVMDASCYHGKEHMKTQVLPNHRVFFCFFPIRNTMGKGVEVMLNETAFNVEY